MGVSSIPSLRTNFLTTNLKELTKMKMKPLATTILIGLTTTGALGASSRTSLSLLLHLSPKSNIVISEVGATNCTSERLR